jgi:hypothetical protein
MTRLAPFGKGRDGGRLAGDEKGMVSSAPMTKTQALPVARVLPPHADLTVGEVDSILEAAYLATAADGHLSEDEYEAFRSVAERLRDIAAGAVKPLTDGDLAKLFERYTVRSDHAARTERITALRGKLERAHVRELAYKVAFAMGLCDLDANDEEVEYGDELVEAFGIDDARADALAAEVYEALDEELDQDSEHP